MHALMWCLCRKAACWLRWAAFLHRCSHRSALATGGLIAFAISSAGATLSLEFGWLFVPLAVLSTFILVMLGSIGQRYSTIAFGTLVVSVYASLTYTPETAWYTNTLLILAGALLYGLVAMLVYIVFPNRTVQENLAKSYEALGRYLQAKGRECRLL